ncbi:hypothetical protein OOK58_43040 [Streptomyces sp. NBC_01728]|uniref:hypothetical protein n=1 Tax=unclassified Streptomyces TaxID=2593676 RepID=UPI00225BD952|nr:MULTISPECIES: hypothetical protein [unclassified Streptomyces]MCX4458689.1 hypothetical protein [Streptomyces sp. NBC_01719]MCX4498046.1 hypothetical protein [Streptomyces sp. NBC_01728]
MSADDDAERKRIEARLYTKPKAMRRAGGQRPQQQPQRGGLTLSGAQALMAQMAAQDAQLGAG